MSQVSRGTNRGKYRHPSLLWVAFFGAGLTYLSLWLVDLTVWHLAVFLITLTFLGIRSPNPIRQFGYLLAIVTFLFLLQIIFSPYMKDMFIRSLHEGFKWSDWRYLFIAIERFTLPLAFVASFQKDLAKPDTIAQLTLLLMPFQRLGIKIHKLQMLILLSLKFMPDLKREWERFDQLQTYFVAKLPRRNLLQRLSYWQGVLKAMIAHTLQQAVKTGDLLALRGMPDWQLYSGKEGAGLAVSLWILMGLGSLGLDMRLLFAWIFASLWLSLAFIATAKGRIS